MLETTTSLFTEMGLFESVDVAEKKEPSEFMSGKIAPEEHATPAKDEDFEVSRNRAYTNAQNCLLNFFEQLQLSLSSRKNHLLDELKAYYEQSQAENSNIEEFHVDFHSSGDLLRLVESYGRVVVAQHAEPIDETSFKITGRGLKSCTVNEEATFSLSLKNRQSMLEQMSNASSLLDIFIINNTTENETTPTETPSAVNAKTRKKSPDLNTKQQQSSTTHKPTNKPLKKPTETTRECNCDCKMECLGDGLYEVKYKLDRKGIYSLNVLVNKKHVLGSPFNLVCLEAASLPVVRTLSRVSSAASKKSTATTRQPVKSHSSFNLKAVSAFPAARVANSPRVGVEKKQAVATQKSVPAASLKKTKSPSSFSLQTSPPPAKHMNIKSLLMASQKSPPSSHAKLSVSPEKHSLSLLQCGGGSTSPINTLSNYNEDSLMSSAHSMAGSDSNSAMSNPLSPALSKINISNIENFNDLTENKKEDDFLFQIGRRGRAVSEFMNPQAVCATGEYIYVTDSNNQKIEAFGHNGEYKFSLGWNGMNVGSKIRRPIGIDCKTDGKILVVDYEFKCVNVYEETGKFVTRICQNRLLGEIFFL
jgi:hypothetical protein